MNFKCEKGKIVCHMNMVGSLIKCMVNDILSTHAYCVHQMSASCLPKLEKYVLVVYPNQIKVHSIGLLAMRHVERLVTDRDTNAVVGRWKSLPIFRSFA